MTRHGRQKYYAWLFFSALTMMAYGQDRRVGDPHISAQSFDIAKHGDLIYVPVCVSDDHDREYPLLFDTGTNRHVVDTKLRRFTQGLPNRSEGDRRLNDLGFPWVYNNGAPPVSVFPARIGRFALRGPFPIHFRDLSAIREVTGRAFFGIVGAPFLRDRIVQINFFEGRLIVSQRRVFDATGWTKQPLTIGASGLPYAPRIRVGERDETFLIDTGNEASVQLQKWVFDALTTAQHISLNGVEMSKGINGNYKKRRGWLDHLQWGPFAIDRLVVVEGKDNVLGLGYLSRYSIAFDIAHECVYLRKGRDYAKSEFVNQTGIHVKTLGGRVVIVEVEPESVAANAGIRVGDHIVTINKKTTSGSELTRVKQILSEALGKRISLVLTRNGRSFSVSIVVPTRVAPVVKTKKSFE